MRKVHAPFGPLTDADWSEMAQHGHRRREDGSYGLAYDPRIIDNVKKGVADVDLWMFWDRIKCPTFVLRGADSDLLSAETVLQMGERGPKARSATLSGIGHAPALMAADQTGLIENWLRDQA
jgi:pimeloyl-ACP methyl ester carboxylesterase